MSTVDPVDCTTAGAANAVLRLVMAAAATAVAPFNKVRRFVCFSMEQSPSTRSRYGCRTGIRCPHTRRGTHSGSGRLSLRRAGGDTLDDELLGESKDDEQGNDDEDRRRHD